MICGSSVPVSSNMQKILCVLLCSPTAPASLFSLCLKKKKKKSLTLCESAPLEKQNPSFGLRRDTDSVLSQPTQTEQLDPGEPADGNLLSVRKPTVGRTHSLPNDSYMFLPPQPLGHKDQAQLLTQSQAPQHIQSTHRAQSGTVVHLYTRRQQAPAQHNLTAVRSVFFFFFNLETSKRHQVKANLIYLQYKRLSWPVLAGLPL